MTDRRTVSVFGSADLRPGHVEYVLAERVGHVLGSWGYAVASGGYGGAMEAVSRGAKRAGAAVIGVTYRLWPTRPNPFVDRVIEAADLYERLRTLLDIGRAGYVALPGATGTLLELAAAWELIGKGLLAGRPIVCVGGFWRPLVLTLQQYKPSAVRSVSLVDSPEQLAEHFPPL